MKKYLISACFLLLSGCGTVFSGTNQTVTVNTNVERAKVYVNGMPACSTPCAVDLNRSNVNTTLILNGVEQGSASYGEVGGLLMDYYMCMDDNRMQTEYLVTTEE